MTYIYLDYNAPVAPQLYITFLGALLSIPASWYAATRLVPAYLYHKKITGFVWRIIGLIVANVLIVYLFDALLYHYFTGRPVVRQEESYLV